MRPYILAENNWESINDHDTELAILPWGATEAHNYHLPYATDNIQNEFIISESAKIAWDKGAKVTVLPNLPFGVNTGQSDIKLDINLLPSTQLAILTDIVEVLNRQGIHKLLLFNGHGGNDFKPIVRELGYKFPKMFITLCNWYQIFDLNDYFEKKNCNHAGEMETSLMMAIAPEMVRPLDTAGDGAERMSKIKGIKEGWVWAERRWSRVTKDTGIGYPKNASKEKGERFFKNLTNKIAEMLVDLANADINDLYE